MAGRVKSHGSLPAQPTSFIGREREREQVRDALRATRLLTLTGAGGIGKTRLALQVAEEEAQRFPDGVRWIDLAPLTEHESVADALAEAFEVRPLPGMTSLQAVSASVAAKHALVVLDNCEHLLDASAEVAGAVHRAGDAVTILATSRSPLGLPDEDSWSVPSLSVPDAAEEPVEAVTRSESGRLFTDRARQADHSFELDDENAAAVARICGELDGIPLAIELAAARTRVLSSDEIADALADRLRVLGGGPRREAARQQTLRASIEWSHELLDERERVLFRRLGVFAGGHDLDGAERVCAFDGLSRAEILDLLDSLIEKSLVSTEKRGAKIRFGMLETIRQYSGGQLSDSGEAERVRQRHLDHYLGLAEEAAPHLGRGGERAWFDVLDSEAANLAAALGHAIATRPDLALRLSVALSMWRRARRPISETETVYERLLAASEAEPAGDRARVLWARAYNALGGGELEAAEVHATDALALAEEAGDSGTAARSLAALGLGEGYASPDAGRSHLVRAARLADEAGDEWASVEAAQFTALTYLFQDRHAEIEQALAAVDDWTGKIAEGDQLTRRALIRGSMRLLDGELDSAADVLRPALAADVEADPAVRAWVGAQVALLDVLRGVPEEGEARLQGLLDVAVERGGGLAVPALLIWTAFAELSQGGSEAARDRLRAVIPIVEGRDCLLTLWAYWLLAESLRMLGSEDAAETAKRAVALGEQAGNRLGAGRAHLTLARLAAARGDWSAAERHALVQLDACAEGGHATFLPATLDALAEIAAGLDSDEEAARLLGAAAAGRKELGVARWFAEAQHWGAIEDDVRSSLGETEYASARKAGAELGLDEAVAWVRRARGSRKRPAGGWESLTPTETKVVELVAEGMTNPQVAERMFITRATVKTHLSHIYGKLDVTGRAQLAAAVARRDD